MALKIRLRQQGRTNRISYRLVVTDCRSPRDGKYVEALGWYHPVEQDPEKILSVKPDRIQHWLDQGAQMTECAHSLIMKAAPSVIRTQNEKTLAKRAKNAKKRKARKQAETK